MLILIAALIAGPAAVRPRPSQPAADAPIQQLSPAALRAEIDSYLGVIDVPIAVSQWRALGPQAAPILEQIIGDAQAFPSRRAKAVDGLVAAAPDRAAALAPQLLQSESQPVVVRVAALHGAARVLSSAKLLAALKPVLETAKQPGLRKSAADVLARHGKRAGCRAVRAQAEREESGAFDSALTHCE
jgi:hypothetical protein